MVLLPSEPAVPSPELLDAPPLPEVRVVVDALVLCEPLPWVAESSPSVSIPPEAPVLLSASLDLVDGHPDTPSITTALTTNNRLSITIVDHEYESILVTWGDFSQVGSDSIRRCARASLLTSGPSTCWARCGRSDFDGDVEDRSTHRFAEHGSSASTTGFSRTAPDETSNASGKKQRPRITVFRRDRSSYIEAT
jgi:hypothetical protein